MRARDPPSVQRTHDQSCERPQERHPVKGEKEGPSRLCIAAPLQPVQPRALRSESLGTNEVNRGGDNGGDVSKEEGVLTTTITTEPARVAAADQLY